MSGGGGALSVERTKRGKAGKRKKKKRVGFTLDMTPLVDITFLLLTFFMFTTTMAAPQVMEMSIPPEQETVEVKQSELFQIFIRGDGVIFTASGQDTPVRTELKDIRKIVEQQHLRLSDPNKQIVAVKTTDDASYGLVVSILDQLNLAEVAITEKVSKQTGPDGKPKKRERRFTIAKILDEEAKKIQGL